MAPNKLQIIKDDNEEFVLVNEEVKLIEYIIELKEPNIALVTYPDGTDSDSTWTMVYDQGFVIETPIYRFVANFKHTLKDDHSTLEKL